MSKNADEHYCLVNLSEDTVTDIYSDRDRWACKKCGREIIVEETPTSPILWLIMGTFLALISIVVGSWLVKFL